MVAIYLAFHFSYRAARLRERLGLEGGELVLARRQLGGRIDLWRFPAAWVRIGREEDVDGRGCLRLASHGREVACARYLSQRERAEVALALGEALGR